MKKLIFALMAILSLSAVMVIAPASPTCALIPCNMSDNTTYLSNWQKTCQETLTLNEGYCLGGCVNITDPDAEFGICAKASSDGVPETSATTTVIILLAIVAMAGVLLFKKKQ